MGSAFKVVKGPSAGMYRMLFLGLVVIEILPACGLALTARLGDSWRNFMVTAALFIIGVEVLLEYLRRSAGASERACGYTSELNLAKVQPRLALVHWRTKKVLCDAFESRPESIWGKG